MTYKELQAALRHYKEQGLTTITLNSPKFILEAELERLTATKNEETEPEVIEKRKVGVCRTFETTIQGWTKFCYQLRKDYFVPDTIGHKT